MKTNYWDKAAHDYDNHIKKSERAYEKLFELTKNEINITQTLLDIGTGTGEIPILLTDYVDKIFATDYSEEMINIANTKVRDLKIANITFQVQDCYNLNFCDEMFDIILAANILHLLDKPEQFLKSIKRLLKENGKLIIPTFIHNANIKTRIISKIMEIKGHPIITRFDSKRLIGTIENCGYKVDKQILLPSIMPMLYVIASKK